MPLQAKASWNEAARKIRYGIIGQVVTRGGLIGKKCWKVTVSYGELTLHIGNRLSYDNPRMAGEKKGEIIFSTSGTGWVLLTKNGLVKPTDGTEEVVEERAKAIEGSKLTEFGVVLPAGGVVLAFSNGYRLFVQPTSVDANYDLPFWQLFLPESRVMTFGPGPKLSFRRSDLST